MKKCKYCQTDIDPKAKVCPNCRKKQGMPKWLIAIIVIVVIVIIASASGDTDENAIEGDSSNNSNQTIEKFTYEISDQYSNSIGYYIEGNIKNNKDKDYSYVQIEFVCYDADGNNLGTAIDNTNNLLGNETWKFKAIAIFSDASNVDHCDYHEITSW